MNFSSTKILALTLILLMILAACGGTSDEPAVAPESVDDGSETVAEAEPAPTDEPMEEEAEPVATEEPAPTEEPMEEEAEEPAPAEEEAPPTAAAETVTDPRPDRLRFATEGWGTDWTKSIIDLNDLLSGGPPRDGIPPLDEPTFVSIEEASEWLVDVEPVVVVEINGEARAYPLQILTWHEIVNDELGGVPVTITFCPLCNSAIAFDRRLNGEIYDFGTSGLLRLSDLVMWDRQTETLWQQFTGEAIVGELTGEILTFLPSSIVSFADFQAAFPDSVVLSRNTGFSRNYGSNPYVGYDRVGSNPFLFFGPIDGRLPAVARVVTVGIDENYIAYPVLTLQEVGVINHTFADVDLAVFHTDGTTSALGAASIAEAEDVGATGVFDRNLDGQLLSFTSTEDGIVDDQTGSTWNILGQAIAGPLEGSVLTPIIHADHFWFSWAAFRPDTVVYE